MSVDDIWEKKRTVELPSMRASKKLNHVILIGGRPFLNSDQNPQLFFFVFDFLWCRTDNLIQATHIRFSNFLFEINWNKSFATANSKLPRIIWLFVKERICRKTGEKFSVILISSEFLLIRLSFPLPFSVSVFPPPNLSLSEFEI